MHFNKHVLRCKYFYLQTPFMLLQNWITKRKHFLNKNIYIGERVC